MMAKLSEVASTIWANATSPRKYIRRYWIGTLLILAATAIFFWPMITRAASYSEGGDAMFNAWTLARDQHCILAQSCPQYINSNIYYPHPDTMLYSETQLSAGLLTLPLYWINNSPLFSYNIWTVISFFLSGWFVYLLVKHISRGNEVVSVLAGLAFEFAPFKIAAVSHLQSLSIFYLPLAILMVLKYLEKKNIKWLVFLWLSLVLQFYASWYQMAFVLLAMSVLILGLIAFRLTKPKQILMLGAAVALAIATTMPLAVQYVRFSKANHAAFSVADQTKYASSLADYLTPDPSTIVGGVFYHFHPHAQSYNLDSRSFHGITLYLVFALILLMVFVWRRGSLANWRRYGLAMTFLGIGVAGFIVSLGPLLKIRGNFMYPGLGGGIPITIPLPYLLVDRFLPQLSFIRAVGRSSGLVLLALCIGLAFLPGVLKQWNIGNKARTGLYALICLLVAIELLPQHQVAMSTHEYNYTGNIPAVYKYIKAHPEVNNIVIISADVDYPNAQIPVARAEEVMWSGYYNRNIFNGYSGYTPPEYFSQINDFSDFHSDDVAKMRALNLRYILVDKQLSTSNPELANQVDAAVHHKIYEDMRFSLFSLQ